MKGIQPLDWIMLGALAVVYALLFPLYRLGDFLIALVFCGAGTFLFALLRRHHAKRRPQPIPASGDKAADSLITQGKKSIEQLQALQRTIHDAEMKKGIARITETGRKVFIAISDKPERAGSARIFTEYYLPTALKLLSSYERLQEESVSGGHIEKTREEIRGSLGTIAEAFDRQLDSLYRDDWMDITADITVLEGMLQREGVSSPMRE